MKNLLFFLIFTLLLLPTTSFSLGDSAGDLSEVFDTSLRAYHTPIYPRSGRTVTFMAKANHANGVKKIRFWVKLYHMTVGTDGVLNYGSPIGSWDSDTTGNSCVFSKPYPTTATCSFPFNQRGRWVPTDSYAVYSVSMRDGNDILHRDRKIRADMKIIDPDIKDARHNALRIYRRGVNAEKFVIVFVADDSFTDQNTYISVLETQVPNGLLKVAPPDHHDHYVRFFNLYMDLFSQKLDISYTNPDGSGCSDSNLSSLLDEIPNADDLTFADDFIVAHNPSIQDCSQAGLSTADDSNVVNHELNHSLFRLRDEYSSGGSSDAVGPHKNRYASSTECVSHGSGTHATEYAASPGCRALSSTNTAQHWCPAGDIMVSNSSSMSTEEHAQVLDYIGDGGLSAFSVPPDPRLNRVNDRVERNLVVREIDDAILADQQEERQEKLAKTLIIKLKFIDKEVHFVEKKIMPGSAPHLFFPNLPRDFLVSVQDRQGNALQNFWISDPRDIDNEKPLVEGEEPGPAPIEGTAHIRIPFDPKMGKILIQNRAQQVVTQVQL